ncbi:MAG: MBOAT family protein [Lachnospiraceae bacterium]|nr:MBOAT family protein [Lachnospiraceae bacterium]
MLFNSLFFILVFLPLCVAGYYLLMRAGKAWAQIFLILMSLWFYGYFRPSYLPIIISSILVNYLIISLIIKDGRKTVAAACLFAAGLIFNIGLIGYYKYSGFLVWNIDHFFDAGIPIPQIVLPLGISFFTFQQLSSLIDAWKGRLKRIDLREYALYVTFFPQLVAGPIVRHDELIPQFEDGTKDRPDAQAFLQGLMWFALGLAKKVLIADRFGEIVTAGFGDISVLTAADTWIVMLAYTMQIYFDFSGYSDMACGLASLFGFKLPQNFDSPYRALSLRDFWKRWHMTLTRFLTQYIYIPLGGNRKGMARTCINMMIVFLVSGIWHGANYTFILWGLLHGAVVVFDRLFEKQEAKIPAAVRWAGSFFVINILWLLFRADGIRDWVVLVRRLFSFGAGIGISDAVAGALGEPWQAACLYVSALALCLLAPNNYKRKWSFHPAVVTAVAALFAICLISLNRVSVFLYFNF